MCSTEYSSGFAPLPYDTYLRTLFRPIYNGAWVNDERVAAKSRAPDKNDRDIGLDANGPLVRPPPPPTTVLIRRCNSVTNNGFSERSGPIEWAENKRKYPDRTKVRTTVLYIEDFVPNWYRKIVIDVVFAILFRKQQLPCRQIDHAVPEFFLFFVRTSGDPIKAQPGKKKKQSRLFKN